MVSQSVFQSLTCHQSVISLPTGLSLCQHLHASHSSIFFQTNHLVLTLPCLWSSKELCLLSLTMSFIQISLQVPFACGRPAFCCSVRFFWITFQSVPCLGPITVQSARYSTIWPLRMDPAHSSSPEAHLKLIAGDDAGTQSSFCNGRHGDPTGHYVTSQVIGRINVSGRTAYGSFHHSPTLMHEHCVCYGQTAVTTEL